MRRALIVVLLLALSACASLGPLTEGSAPGLAWYAVDAALTRKTAESRTWLEYGFALVVKETRGVALTFNEIKTTVYQPGIDPWSGVFRGVWELPASDAFKIPLSVSVSCPHFSPNCGGSNVPVPLWQITMAGRAAGGEPVRFVIDLRMPPDPPPAPSSTASAIRAISLAAPRVPAAQGSAADTKK